MPGLRAIECRVLVCVMGVVLEMDPRRRRPSVAWREVVAEATAERCACEACAAIEAARALHPSRKGRLS